MEQKLENILKSFGMTYHLRKSHVSFTSVYLRTYPHYRDKNVW